MADPNEHRPTEFQGIQFAAVVQGVRETYKEASPQTQQKFRLAVANGDYSTAFQALIDPRSKDTLTVDPQFSDTSMGSALPTAVGGFSASSESEVSIVDSSVADTSVEGRWSRRVSRLMRSGKSSPVLKELKQLAGVRPEARENEDSLLAPREHSADKHASLDDLIDAIFRTNQENMTKLGRQRRRLVGLLTLMYSSMFLIGLGAFTAAIAKGLLAQSTAETAAAATIGGLSVATFVSLFLLKPLESLERNGLLFEGMTLCVNTYWTRLMYMDDPDRIDDMLEDVTGDTLRNLMGLWEIRDGRMKRDSAEENGRSAKGAGSSPAEQSQQHREDAP